MLSRGAKFSQFECKLDEGKLPDNSSKCRICILWVFTLMKTKTYVLKSFGVFSEV